MHQTLFRLRDGQSYPTKFKKLPHITEFLHQLPSATFQNQATKLSFDKHKHVSWTRIRKALLGSQKKKDLINDVFCILDEDKGESNI